MAMKSGAVLLSFPVSAAMEAPASSAMMSEKTTRNLPRRLRDDGDGDPAEGMGEERGNRGRAKGGTGRGTGWGKVQARCKGCWKIQGERCHRRADGIILWNSEANTGIRRRRGRR